MLSTNFSTEQLIEQWSKEEREGNPFPIDLDVAWRLAGYKKKQEGILNIQNNFTKGVDYISAVCKNPAGRGRDIIVIKMTVRCFLSFVLFCKSQSGKDVRSYILSLIEENADQIFTSDIPKTDDKTRNPNAKKDYSGFIYLVRATRTSFYKIGMSKDPYKRLQSLQTGTPFELVIINRIYTFDCLALEKALHEYYQAYWMRGEWFDMPQSEIENFAKVANELDQNIELTLLPGVSE